MSKNIIMSMNMNVNLNENINVIKKILIANRGEIACRIIRTAREMGIICVAIYSEADTHAPHVRLADETYCIGPAPSTESYLDFEKIITLAKEKNCDAVHPGYGFLSENAEFAAACKKNNIIFIGPSEQAILAMGSKSAAKSIMEKAGVPILPGYHGDNQDCDFLLSEANRIGYPLLIKAVAGGGGKGMRIVNAADEFISGLEGARREAKKSFRDDRVLLERYLTSPRHIEVQIMADTHGNIIHLFERDCSIQRRNQKIIEEAPAPKLTTEIRQKLGETGIEAARSIHYVGAGTIEFLFQDNQFYFMEMNTRLQVEHPITEKITGLDLVKMQIDIASGKALTLTQSDISIHGHAIEVRLYAENPDDNYMPATGTLFHYKEPRTSDHIRLDSGVTLGSEIGIHYDPMLGKLITWGKNREHAISLMKTALHNLQIAGVITNMNFLRRIITSSVFSVVPYNTAFLNTHAHLFEKKSEIPALVYAAAAIYPILQASHTSAWKRYDSWRMNTPGDFHFCFSIDDNVNQNENAFLSVRVTRISDERFNITINHGVPLLIDAMIVDSDENTIRIRIRSEPADTHTLTIIQKKCTTTIFGLAQQYEITHFDPNNYNNTKHEHEGNLTAPMPGTVVAILAKAGDCVKQGQALMIIEAMKMEHTISAPHDGVVENVYYTLNARVNEGAELISFIE